MIASFGHSAEESMVWSAVFKVLFLFLPITLPKYEPSGCAESFLVFLTETLACVDAVTLFLTFVYIFLLERITKITVVSLKFTYYPNGSDPASCDRDFIMVGLFPYWLGCVTIGREAYTSKFKF